MYLLNMLFDLAKPDGLFSDSVSAAPLDQSRSWLVLVDAAGNPVPDLATNDPTNLPAGQSWQIVGELPVYIPNAVGQVVGVRIAPISTSNPPLSAASQIVFVAAFGAPIPKATKRASPFKFNSATDVATTFVGQGVPAGPPQNGWYFKLHRIDHSSLPYVVDRYEFSVGAVISESGTTRHFGMDPEMDVGN